jgi:hypothetical protein
MLDLLINAAYVFGFATFTASAGTEAISSFLRWRAKMLFDGVKTILNESITGLATVIYRNPLVNPRSTGEDSGDLAKGIPSYIDPKSFAVALTTALGLEQSRLDGLKGTGLPHIIEWVRTQIAPLQNEPRLSLLLADAIHRNNADLQLVDVAIAEWFENATDRISGAYKRRTQASNFIIGLILAVVLDLNPLPRGIADMIQSKSMAAAGFAPPNVSATSPAGRVPSPVATVVTPAPTGAAPIGGSSAGAAKGWGWDYAAKAVGWLAVAASTLLGSPFWFGVLSKITNVRGAGAAPSRSGTPFGSVPNAAPAGVSSTAMPAGER